MKRLFWLIGILLLATLGCVRELPVPDPESDPIDAAGKVKIYFSIPVTETPSTKVLGEGGGLFNPDNPNAGGLKTLHVAVFGSSGYLKEYVKAENLGTGSSYDYTDAYGKPQSATLINFSVTLSLSPKPRFIHLLGNCPEEILPYNDTTTLFSLLSEEGEAAYWQTIDLPKGIAANVVTDPTTGHEQYEKNADGTYKPDAATQDAFLHLFLIRNWAKIFMAVDDGAQFKLKKFALINFPKKGVIAASIAKDNGSSYFVRNYDGQDDQDLVNMGYEGVLPEENALYNTYVPSHAEFTGTSSTTFPIYNYYYYTDGTKASENAYMYERPVPDKLSTFVLIYGTYTGGGEEKDCYYKIDLSDDTSGDDKYYPIFRNFQYKIEIHKIESAGYDTPKEAADSPGSVSVSANTSISGFADISDGTARLAVQPWMAQSYNKAGYEDQLFVKFFSDISQGVDLHSNMTNTAAPGVNPVTYELISRGEGLPDLIEILPNDAGNKAFYAPEGTSSVNYGWRKLRFKTASVLPTEKQTQTLRVKGVYTNAAGAPKTLYRDIKITLLPSQAMHVWCTETDLTAQSSIPSPDLVNPITVKGVRGKPLYLNMALPKDLPESMFPLEIAIEPEELTLTPNVSSGKDLPVVSRETISDKHMESYQNASQYIRNLDWSEYITSKSISIESEEYALVTSAFLTNRCESGTKIWVNNEYFYRASTSFNNTHEFAELSFQSSIRESTGSTVKVHFEVERKGDNYPTVTFITTGMVIDGDVDGLSNPTPYGGGQAVYSFTPKDEATDFICKTQVNTGDVSFSAQSDGYTDQTIESHRFTIYGFLDGIKAESYNSKQSYVVYGSIIHDAANSDLAAPFGYCHEPGYPAQVKALINNDNRYDGLNYSYNATTWFITGLKNYPNGVDSTYHEIGFRTNKEKPAASYFRLIANGYVEKRIDVPRFTGTIGNATGEEINKSNYLKSGGLWPSFGNPNWNFTYTSTDNTLKATVAFEKKNAGSTFSFVNNNGFKLSPASGTTEEFTMIVNSEEINNETANPLYYVEIVFDKAPNDLSVEEADAQQGAGVKRIMNSKTAYRYLWTTPKNPSPATKQTKLTIKTDHAVIIQKIILKSIKYTD